MTQNAAEIISAHNGGGGLPGAIASRKALILRRKGEGKDSPAAEKLLAELMAIDLKFNCGEFTHDELMWESRNFKA